MTRPEELAREIFGRRAAQYTVSATHADPMGLARLVELARPEAHWTVLDIATGTGHTARAVAPHAARVVGTDLTRGMLAEARRAGAAPDGGRIRLMAADVHRLPFSARAFQLVTCRRAAHHFSRIRRALSEMHRVLAPGGRLVIDDRSVPEDDAVDEIMDRLDRWHDASHVRQYRPGVWVRMLEEAGFRVETVEPFQQHRPLSSLTGGAAAEDARRIRETLDALDGRLKRLFRLEEVGGELHLNHWYVRIAAHRSA